MSKEAGFFGFENKKDKTKEDLYSFWKQGRKEFENKSEKEKWFYIPDVPELEKAAKSHRDGLEEDIGEVIRKVARPVQNFRLQYGDTCGLTTFQMILGSLDKPVPSYEEAMGKPWHEITGSGTEDYRRVLASQGIYGDIKETVLFVGNFKKGKNDVLRDSIFKLIDEGNFLYVLVNWEKLHGRWRSDGSSGYDHALVLSGARETSEPVQGDKINYLITDPNHPSYHNIWVPEELLFKAMLHSAKINGYRIEKPKITERIRKRFLGRRLVRAHFY